MDTQSFHSGARPSYERMTASCLCETTKKNWTIVSKRDIFPLAFAFFYSAVIKTHIVFSTLLGHSHTSSGDVIIKLFRAWLSNPSIIRLFPHLDYHESVILPKTRQKGLILIKHINLDMLPWFLLHNKGAITSIFTGDWLLTEGENPDKLGECLKKTEVRHQDQRRIESIMHCFPSNFWWNKITTSKESDKCDLCKTLWVSEGRFTTEGTLPIQTLGHIQHTCEALSELHTMTHHRYWRLIHGELSRLAPSKWRFVCITELRRPLTQVGYVCGRG